MQFTLHRANITDVIGGNPIRALGMKLVIDKQPLFEDQSGRCFVEAVAYSANDASIITFYWESYIGNPPEDNDWTVDISTGGKFLIESATRGVDDLILTLNAVYNQNIGG